MYKVLTNHEDEILTFKTVATKLNYLQIIGTKFLI